MAALNLQGKDTGRANALIFDCCANLSSCSVQAEILNALFLFEDEKMFNQPAAFFCLYLADWKL